MLTSSPVILSLPISLCLTIDRTQLCVISLRLQCESKAAQEVIVNGCGCPSKKVMVHPRGPKCYLGQIQHVHNLGFWFQVLHGNCHRPLFCAKSPLNLTRRDLHQECFQNVFLIFRSGVEGYVSPVGGLPTWQVWEGKRDKRCRNWTEVGEVSSLSRLKHPGWREERDHGLWRVQGHGHKVYAKHKASGKGHGQQRESELQTQKSGA